MAERHAINELSGLKMKSFFSHDYNKLGSFANQILPTFQSFASDLFAISSRLGHGSVDDKKKVTLVLTNRL